MGFSVTVRPLGLLKYGCLRRCGPLLWQETCMHPSVCEGITC